MLKRRQCSRFCRSRLWPAAAALALSTAGVSLAHAHGAERGLVMLLPTGHHMAAAALAVAATFAVLLCVPSERLQRLAAWSLPLRLMPFRSTPRKRRLPHWPSWLSFSLLCLLLLAGQIGSRDPLTNPLPLMVWTLWWAGFTLLQCVLGDLWRRLNPWSGPLAIIRRWLRRRAARMALRSLKPPRFLGYAPAVGLFFGFAWFELIDPAPADPSRLAAVVALYWCFTLVACLLFGEKYWLRYAEPFSVLFRLIGHCAPLRRQPASRARALCLPGARLISLQPMPMSGVFFILLVLSSVSFDGLSKTFLWLDWLGVNPLAFPGRSAVVGANTLGLLLAFMALAAAFFLCVWLGCWLNRSAHRFAGACGCLIYAIIPVALAFHFAHYLAAMLAGGQYALLAFNDPFALGWNLLAAEGYQVTSSLPGNLQGAALIWTAQTLAITLGHASGISIAHATAARLFGAAKPAAVSQVFLAALMVAYTLFGLWLLSTPAIA